MESRQLPKTEHDPIVSRLLATWIALLPVVTFLVVYGVSSYDLPILRLLSEAPSTLKRGFRYIGYTGDATLPLAGSLLLFLYLKLRQTRVASLGLTSQHFKNFGLTLFCALAYSGLSVQLMKIALGRQRPYITDMMTTKIFQPMNSSWEYHSFPSGHTQVVSCVATVLIFYFPKWRWPILIWAVLVASSRIVTGNHYPSDLIGGGYLGTLGALMMLFLLNRHQRPVQQP